MVVLHHLLDLLEAADKNDQLAAEFIIIPMVNPLGMAQIRQHHHSGRYDFTSGLNFNRAWPDFAAVIQQCNQNLLDELGDDPDMNRGVILAAVEGWIAQQKPVTALQALRLEIIKEAYDSDVILDLHCDVEAINHIYITPQLMPEYQDLADWMGSYVTLTAENSGGGSFDEVWPRLWIDLARLAPDNPLPSPVLSATLEYRGLRDASDALNLQDAHNLMGFFKGRGFLLQDTLERPERPERLKSPSGSPEYPASMPTALPLAATQLIQAEHAGIVCYHVSLGEIVAQGDLIAEIIVMDGDKAYRARTAIYASVSGIVFSLALQKYVWRGAAIAKIAGSTPLAERVGVLLEN